MTRDEIILMADASGISLYGMGKDRAKFIHYLEAFAKLVADKENKECEKLAATPVGTIAAAIRARGQA